MSKHTPGPWLLLPSRTLVNVKGAYGEQICQLPKGSADAALIAAAPEMLEALRYVMDNDGSLSKLHAIVTNAIAKAEGR